LLLFLFFLVGYVYPCKNNSLSVAAYQGNLKICKQMKKICEKNFKKFGDVIILKQVADGIRDIKNKNVSVYPIVLRCLLESFLCTRTVLHDIYRYFKEVEKNVSKTKQQEAFLDCLGELKLYDWKHFGTSFDDILS